MLKYLILRTSRGIYPTAAYIGVFIATGKTITTPYRMKIRGHALPSESFVQRKC